MDKLTSNPANVLNLSDMEHNTDQERLPAFDVILRFFLIGLAFIAGSIVSSF